MGSGSLSRKGYAITGHNFDSVCHVFSDALGPKALMYKQVMGQCPFKKRNGVHLHATG